MRIKRLNLINSIEFAISIVIALSLIAVLPPFFEKYIIRLVNKELTEPETRVSYSDLDKDGASEKIILRGSNVLSSKNDYANAVLFNSENELIDQWNFSGKWYDIIETGDYNNDGEDEIFLFSAKEDSILLLGYSLFNNELIFNDKFIAKGNPSLNIPANVNKGKLIDVNNDGYKEVVFAIMTSFLLAPRALYAYDIKNDTLITSENYGSWRNELYFCDINGDNKEEILSGSTSPGNSNSTDTLKYLDTCAWVMAFQTNFELLFNPLEFCPYSSSIDVFPYITENNTYLAVLYKSSKKANPPFLSLYNQKGKLIRKRELKVEKVDEIAIIITDSSKYDRLYFIEKAGLIHEVDSMLRTINTIKLEEVNDRPREFMDIDNDSKKELVFYNQTQTKLIITRNDLTYPVTIDIPEDDDKIYCSVKYSKENHPILVVQRGAHLYSYSYKRNVLYEIKYVLYFLLVVIVFFFIRLIQGLRSYQLKKENKKLDRLVKEKTEKLKERNDKLVKANNEIKYQKDEIVKQHEEIQLQKEELLSQNEELFDYKERLEYMVEEKTKELSIALSRAQESDKLKSAFLANMSHEIRTPMNAIIGFSEILIKINKDTAQKEYLNSIKLSGKTLLSLINDILDLSKIEAGEMVVKSDIVSIKTLFSELHQIFRIDAELKGLSLLTEVDTSVPEFIELDELRVRQVLINLINNAIKFTHQGYVKIKAKAIASDGKVQLFLIVSDSGIGIKESEKEKIFEAFMQSNSYDSRTYDGTGLGLAIISKIIKMFNGTINVDSKIGNGSTFTIELPDIPIYTDTVFEKKIETINPDNIVFDKSTILIADDRQINIDVVKGLLKQYNFDIIEVNDGIQAVELAIDKLPDLIFMDLKMPEMNGYQATSFLKSNETTRHIPIIVLTASVLGFNENILEEYNFAGYLSKPIDFKLLVHELTRFLPYKNVMREIEVNEDIGTITSLEENHILNEYLKTNIMPVWEKLNNSRNSILEKEFASKIIKAGKLYDNEYLKEKGKKIELAIETFNIDKTKSIIDELILIFDRLYKV